MDDSQQWLTKSCNMLNIDCVSQLRYLMRAPVHSRITTSEEILSINNLIVDILFTYVKDE